MSGYISRSLSSIFGRFVGQTAAVPVIVRTTVGPNDGSFIISAEVLVTVATNHSFNVAVDFTDEGGTARTALLIFINLGAAIVAGIINTGGAIPYPGIPVQIRCKAGTTITVKTTGTFTVVTYNVESSIIQIA